jgi:hypothetical protein
MKIHHFFDRQKWLQVFFAFAVTIGVFFVKNIALAQPQSGSNSIQLGQELYLKNCSGCHLPIAAEVLPTDTWRALLSNPAKHYGESLPKIIGINQYLMWQYLSNYSRPLLKDEPLPMYVANSRYFKALHPQVNLPKPANLETCASCHPNFNKLDYRTLNDSQ